MKPMPKSKTPVLSTWKKKTSFKSNIPGIEIKLDQILEEEQIGINLKRVRVSFNSREDRPSSYQINPIPYEQYQRIGASKLNSNNQSFSSGISKVKQFPKKPSIGYISQNSSKYLSIQSHSQSTPIKRIEHLRYSGNTNDINNRQRTKSISSIKSISVKDSVDYQHKTKHKRDNSLQSINNFLGKNIPDKSGQQFQFNVRKYVKNVYQEPISPEIRIKGSPQTAAFSSFAKEITTPSPLNKTQKQHTNQAYPSYIQTYSASPHYIKQESRQNLDQKNKLETNKKQLSHYSMTKNKIAQLKKKFNNQLTSQQFLKANYPYISNFLQSQTKKQQQKESNVFDRLYLQKPSQVKMKSGKKGNHKNQNSQDKSYSNQSKNSHSIPPSQEYIQPAFSFDQYSLAQNKQFSDFRQDKNTISRQIQNPNIKISGKIKADSRELLRQKFGIGIVQFIPQVFRFCIGCQYPILQANIVNHEKTCNHLKLLYDKNLNQLNKYLSLKISEFKRQIEMQISKSQQNFQQQVQNIKKGIKQWLQKSTKNSIPDKQYQQLYQRVKNDFNLGIFRTFENVKKFDWFLRVKGRVQQALLSINQPHVAIKL